MKRDFLRKCPLHLKITLSLFLLGLLVKLLSALFSPFADVYTRTAGAAFRAALGALSSVLPVSIAETLFLLFLPLTVLLAVWIFRGGARRRRLMTALLALLSLCAYLFASFFLLYGAGYHTTPLKERLYPAVTEEVTEDRIYETAVYLMVQANIAASYMTYDKSGAAVNPDGFAETAGKLNAAYESAAAAFDFLRPLRLPAKKIALSVPLTYTKMAGFYTFYTGEVNINTNYPDYIVAFTTAHEMAHRQGIAREDEADFVAFLVCTASDEPFLVYSGYLNMLSEALTALARLNPARASDLVTYADARVRGEYAAYTAAFARYEHTAAGGIADAVNNAYLHAQGVADGVKSYDRALDLAVAYFYDGLENGTLKNLYD